MDLVTSDINGYFKSPRPPDFLSVWTHARWENYKRWQETKLNLQSPIKEDSQDYYALNFENLLEHTLFANNETYKDGSNHLSFLSKIIQK